ncbi:hypothetical protein MPLSOD_110056 [Mesorhizobium sp. SOD10]|nr:hypothetical protein MPLSOD_110056 [Mesorhizobium sp. SOD10]
MSVRDWISGDAYHPTTQLKSIVLLFGEHVTGSFKIGELTMPVVGLGPAYASPWPIAGRQNHRDGARQGKAVGSSPTRSVR